ncbi:16S rRNA processing protein RimM [Alkaliphilus metalliredigens QYMF]|uniref:Ribosome maturation factor RimM n=1 Tax=Alkaliphilus metalliredigens (strain QYMF) TaxID=293826 RepID=RIMM_ALKMQ|nr:ribosome maturation factor RimM [Alkaliphilus metalliredigens]A6TRS7.1 RecName: Full=Ribosome maturation factor RimM [Alkaliphilus metalliredigens QYMF]ABR48895.1 16S rRNA processing protein RimM [Alkaliphilus metalliredigens QYMF]
MKKMLKVGQIVNTHGIKGELKVTSLSDYLERFEELEWVYIQGYDEKYYIGNIKYRPTTVILSFEGYDNINIVEQFKGKYVLIDESQRRELPEDTFYKADLIGLDGYTVEEVYLGKLVDIIQAGSNEVYVFRDKETNKDILIPAVKEFIPEISLEKKRITVDPIEGMIE